ncbi:MAG: hypothetical protein AB1714_12495 [Acidobacteriota bacterium]
MMTDLDHELANAVLGVDTLWGGDVMNPSGTGRFIADSWFSGEPLPESYTHPLAAKLRASGGVSAREIDRDSVREYARAIKLEDALAGAAAGAVKLGGSRGAFLLSMIDSCRVMYDLVLELIGDGARVPYTRAVRASTGRDPQPSDPSPDRERVKEILAGAGHLRSVEGDLNEAVDAWRRDRMVSGREVAGKSAAVIAEYEALTRRNVLPHLPAALRGVPMANISFLPIDDAWFSGSMNYIGRARSADGAPQYEATYEINAALEISMPEFKGLVTHEVVPGHVTTFAFLQRLYTLGQVGFEGTVLTMNSRFAALAEGIANNALLMAHGVFSVDELDDPELRLGMLLALLQDQAKNQSSWLAWGEGRSKDEVEKILRRDFLVSAERADKLSGAWGRHPLLGRMYLPAYQAGTETVVRLRRMHAPEKILPVLYGCTGLVDVVTVVDHL